jgi:hypothetical protein
MTLSQSLDQSFGDLEFFLGEVTEKLSISKVGDTPGTLLAISLWWLECVDDELSTFAVTLSLASFDGTGSFCTMGGGCERRLQIAEA